MYASHGTYKTVMAHIRQSRPDSGLDLKVHGLGPLQGEPLFAQKLSIDRVEALAIAGTHLRENTFITDTFRTDTPVPKGN